MLKKDLKKRIDEAIASKKTSDSEKELLIEIKQELDIAKNEKDYLALALKVINLISALIKITVGSG